MSGLVGLLRLDGLPADRRLLDRLAVAISFRGPDGERAATNGPVGLAHSLLATGVGDSAPPALEDRDLWLAADARLDDRRELRRRLLAAGEKIGSEPTDADLIRAAYRAWGEEAPASLAGDYAFALWDPRRQRLLCARSMFGARQLYYAHRGDELLFGNTLEALRVHPAMPDVLDEDWLLDFLLFGISADPAATVRSAIRRLPPGHLLAAGDGRYQVRRFWQPPAPERLPGRDPEALASRLRELLTAAVADRARAPRLAVLMSGGVDSTAVALTASRHLARRTNRARLQAQTVAGGHLWPQDGEAGFARLVADVAGFPLDVVEIEEDDLLAPPESLPATPEPLHEPLQARSIRQYRRLAATSRVVLTGYGGDAVLRPERGRLWPAPEGGPRHWAAVLRHTLTRRQLPSLGLRSRLAGRRRPALQLPPWLSAGFARRAAAADRLRQASRTLPGAAGFRPGAYGDVTSALWPATFAPLDPEVTRQPLLFSHPFFDLRLLRFLLAVPTVPWCLDKELLRLAMRGRLPERVRTRAKTTPGAAPMHRAVVRRPSGWWQQQRRIARSLEPYVDLAILDRLIDQRHRLRRHEYPLLTRPLCLAHWLGQRR